MTEKRKNQIILIISGIIIAFISIIVGLKVLSPFFAQEEEQPGVVTEIPAPEPNEDPQVTENPETKEYVPVVFIGKNANGEEVYKVIKREYDKGIDGTQLRFALTSLIMGPTQKEKASGIYSEVPTGTTILHVYEHEDKVIIDLSSGFSYGGGTDSVYKRLFQIIKTINRNTDKPAYLYIDGKQADVIGGDGIMISQPLNENSIGE